MASTLEELHKLIAGALPPLAPGDVLTVSVRRGEERVYLCRTQLQGGPAKEDPLSPQHREILALLADRGPLKVATIAGALGIDSAQLYRGPGDIKALVRMGLAERCP